MSDSRVVAVAAGDLHLWHRPPAARTEESWLKVQRRALEQLADLAREHGGVPVLYPGDVFDRHSPPPEIVNLALRCLPRGYGVPGNHDLAGHRLADVKKSGFWTLVEAGKIGYLEPGKPVETDDMRLHGFPHGVPVRPLEKPCDLLLEVAVVHAFVWTKSTGHPGADKADRVCNLLPKLRGYDVAVFGDNHQAILSRPGDGETTIVNPGCLIRRKQSEREYRPRAALIRADGSAEWAYLDCAADRFADAADAAKLADPEHFAAFLAELERLGDAATDFREALLRAADKAAAGEAVRKMILEAMEDGK